MKVCNKNKPAQCTGGSTHGSDARIAGSAACNPRVVRGGTQYVGRTPIHVVPDASSPV